MISLINGNITRGIINHSVDSKTSEQEQQRLAISLSNKTCKQGECNYLSSLNTKGATPTFPGNEHSNCTQKVNSWMSSMHAYIWLVSTNNNLVVLHFLHIFCF